MTKKHAIENIAIKDRKLKILATSDFHGMDIVTKEVAKKAEKEKADLVIVAGDILNFGDYAKNMFKPFIDRGLQVVFVPGNHDPPEAIENFTREYKIKNIHDSYILIGDVGIFGVGGTSNLPHFPFYVSEKETYEILKRGYSKVKGAKKKILVTHEHPAKCGEEKFTHIPGNKSVKKIIDAVQPDVHIHGHMHEMEGFEEKIGKTRMFSVGKRGTIIEV